jgi:hypothetical protein
MIISCYSSNRVPLLTWINDIPPTMDYVIFRGDPNLDSESIYNSESHECVLRCPDTYLGLPHKIKAGLMFVYMQLNPSFVVKIDDDVLVNVPRLLEYAQSTHDHYAGHVTYNYSPEEGLSTVYCGGPVYYLSSTALKCLQDMDTMVFSAEDACVGKHLMEKCKLPVHNIHLYTDKLEQRDKYIAYHDSERIVIGTETYSTHTPAYTITVPPPDYKPSFMRHLSQKNTFKASFVGRMSHTYTFTP